MANNSLRGKPSLVIGSAGFFGGVWAHNDMRRILRAAGADVVDAQVGPVRAEEVFDGRRRLVDASISEQLRQAANTLARRAESSAQDTEPETGAATIRSPSQTARR